MNKTVPIRLPGALRCLDLVIVAFAIWTIGANLAALCGLGLHAAVVLAFAGGATAVAIRVRRAGWIAEGKAPVPAPDLLAGEPAPAAWRIGAALVAALSLAALHGLADLRLAWLLAIVGLGTLALRERNAAPEIPRAAAAPLLLCGAAVLGAVLASLAQRPDADDAFYLQAAIAAAAAPGQPLLAADTLHGLPGLPLILPVYQLHSIEMLWAAVARWTGLPVLDIAHIATPVLAGALLPLAQARLLRLLLPMHWRWGLVVVLAFLLLAGGAVHSFGNFGFVRLHQGKGLLVSIALPALTAYAIEFARAPSRGRGLRLAAAQIAALGFSASAVWLAPAVAGLAVLAALPPARGALRTLAFGAVTSIYPLALGATALGATRDQFAAAAGRGELPGLSDPALAASALSPVLGPEPVASLLLFALIAASGLALQPTIRRFLAVFTLGFLLLFWNPFDANAVANWLAGPGTYWRVFWVLPLPAILAIVSTSGLAPDRPWGAAAGSALTLAALGLLAAAPVVSPASGSQWTGPGWRVPAHVQPLLAQLRNHVAADATVLLPLDAAPWSVMFERSPTPLVVRPEYLGVLRARYGQRELDRRLRLAHAVSGTASAPRAAVILARAITDYDLSAVALANRARDDRTLAPMLAAAGFALAFEDTRYTLWVRPPDPDSQTPSTTSTYSK